MNVEDLEPLIGEWTQEATWPDGRTMDAGRSSYAWLEGGGYVIQRSVAPDPFPNGVSVYGPTVEGDRIVQHYFDSRGVARVYEVSFEGGVLKLWRDGPDWAQSFEGRLSDDGQTITARLEREVDGAMIHDFDIVYQRVS